MKKIVIGLPARNEERAITKSLSSIREAMLFTKRPNMILVVCLNGCVDNTPKLANDFKQEYPDIQCEVIESTEGLVNAQREIVKKFPADIHIFPDSDNTIEINSLELLISELENDSKLVVAYAKTIPLAVPNNLSIFHKIGLLYDSQNLLTKRYYFHGRLFATKDWYIPENEDVVLRATQTKYTSELLKYCKKDIFLYADDIFMSSYVMNKYGIDAIRQVEGAHCFSWSVGSYRDWWNTYRRRNIEMEKMYRWFPEYNHLWPYLNRRTDWSKWFRASFPNKLRWFLFLSMRGWFFIKLKAELFMAKFEWFKPAEQWQVTLTTKNELK